MCKDCKASLNACYMYVGVNHCSEKVLPSSFICIWQPEGLYLGIKWGFFWIAKKLKIAKDLPWLLLWYAVALALSNSLHKLGTPWSHNVHLPIPRRHSTFPISESTFLHCHLGFAGTSWRTEIKSKEVCK